MVTTKTGGIEMRKIGLAVAVMVVLVVLLSVMGCSKKEVSSREEALYATRELSGHKETVYYFSVKGYGSSPFLQDAFYIAGSKSCYRAAHVVLYKDNNDSIKIAIWDDQRPPQQIEIN